jgi:hypothetical protein
MTAISQVSVIRTRFEERAARASRNYFDKKEWFAREAASNPANAVAWNGGVVEAQRASEAFSAVLRCLDKVGERYGYASDREAVQAGVKQLLDELLVQVQSLGGNAFARAVEEAKAAGYAAAIKDIQEWVL